MKPVPIADYLDHIGRGLGEKPSPRREASPFRPRSLGNLSPAEPLSLPAFNPVAKAAAPSRPNAAQRPPRPAWDRAPAAADQPARDALAARETAKAKEIASRLAEAHARGRAEGFAEARAEAEDQWASDRAAAQEQAMMERLDFQLNEYAALEGAIRAGFAEVERHVGAAVARILGPFLVKQVVKYVVEELCKNIARLCAAGSPGLITIRGPEPVLALLRERVEGLPAEVEFVEVDGVEAVVEANATQIVTELNPWAELLASLDA
jgi:hypothetical protein